MKSIYLPARQEKTKQAFETAKISVGTSSIFFTQIDHLPTPLFIVLFMLLGLFFTPTYAENPAAVGKTYFQFNKQNELIRPIGYREWIFVGTPLTPNDMNNGKATFPEFHNVYVDPISWDQWKKTGKFPDGTVVIKELVSVGSKQASSGNGYFQGKYIGLEASLKSKKQFPDKPGNWGFFRFTIENSLDLRKTAAVQPDKNCSACHQTNAATDQVFTQYYPVLRAAKGKGEEGTGGK